MHSRVFVWLSMSQQSESLTIPYRQLREPEALYHPRRTVHKETSPDDHHQGQLDREKLLFSIYSVSPSCRIRMAVAVVPTEPGVAFSTLRARKILILKRVFESRRSALMAILEELEILYLARVNWSQGEPQGAPHCWNRIPALY